MKKQQQKRNSKTVLIVIAVVVLGIVGLVVLLKNTSPYNLPHNTQEQSQQAAIQNDSDLQITSDDLDSADIDGMGNELNQNDSDATTF